MVILPQTLDVATSTTPAENGTSTALSEDITKLLPPSKRGLSSKKRNGVFYTPNEASRLLTEWSIRTAEDTVFEPSFGGCGFLESALNRLQALGAEAPHMQLLGCDVDPTAFTYLTELLDDTPSDKHFKRADFLQVVPEEFSIKQVDAVIGNPPYVSWHNMLPEQRLSASTVAFPNGSRLNNKGSLWTFFIAHSLRFLRSGGRMAWILPGSFIYADYAAALREAIANSFTHSLAIMLAERIFVDAGTEESTVILLAEGFQTHSDKVNSLRFVSASTLAQVPTILSQWNTNKEIGQVWAGQANRLILALPVLQTYDRLLANSACQELGKLAKIRIGLVTGDNSFFVLTKKKAERLGLASKSLRPIIARQLHLRGLQVTAQDLEELESKDAKCLLLNTSISMSAMPAALQDYLKTYNESDIKDNRTFNKRKPWYQIALEAVPDAFFTCMSWYGPQLILNQTATTCTNTVYRVEFSYPTECTPEVRQQLSITLQSTFSQLSAELNGRSYGSGALKLEPSEVKRIALLLPPPDSAAQVVFEKIDLCLRQGKAGDARQLADQYLVEQGLLGQEDAAILQAGLEILRNLRRGTRRPFITQ